MPKTKRWSGVFEDTPTPHAYDALTPDVVLDALSDLGLAVDGRLTALSSYENRVYQVMLDDNTSVVAKFYRPERWSDAQILEEHSFAAELMAEEVPLVGPLSLHGQTLHHAHGFVHAGVGHIHDHIRRAGVVVVGDASHREGDLAIVTDAGTAVACRNLHRSYGGNRKRRNRSVDRGDAGDPTAFAVDLLLVFEQLVEGNEAHPVAALVQTVIVEAGDFHPEGTAFFASAHTYFFCRPDSVDRSLADSDRAAERRR